MPQDILILDGARTPFCTWAGGTKPDGQKGGTLKPIDPFDLGATSLKAALERSKVAPHEMRRVVFGNAYHAGSHSVYGARYVALRAGLPADTTGIAVTMACGSGFQAVISGAEDVERGHALVGVAGADNCSAVPRAVFVPSFKDLLCGRQLAETAQAMSREYGFEREQQDRWSLVSHRRAGEAAAKGYLKEEITPVTVPGPKNADGSEGARVEVTVDDAIRPDANAEYFSSAKLLFEDGCQATAANTHAVVDGGAALVLASTEGAKKAGTAPRARLVGWSVVGVEPEKMALASVKAIRELYQKLGWTQESVELFEINETFASQVIVCLKELDLAEGKVNPNGGGLAIGHPFGASGPRLVDSLLRELERRGLKRGIAAVCAGGGTGVALGVERL